MAKSIFVCMSFPSDQPLYKPTYALTNPDVDTKTKSFYHQYQTSFHSDLVILMYVDSYETV